MLLLNQVHNSLVYLSVVFVFLVPLEVSDISVVEGFVGGLDLAERLYLIYLFNSITPNRCQRSADVFNMAGEGLR